MHKIINKKSIQKITAIIIIMIMCNFIMSGKVWAVEKWMSLEEYEKLTVGSMDIKQEVSATSQAVKNLANKWNITPEQALEVIKNHATEANTLGIMEEMADTGTTYSVYNIKLQPTEEEIKNYNIPVDDDGYASADTSYWGETSDLEGAEGDKVGGLLIDPIASLLQGIGDGVNRLIQIMLIGDNSPVHYDRGFFDSPTTITDVVSNNKVKEGDESNLPTEKIVKDYIDGPLGGYTIADIKLTPAEIFAGNVSALDANFFKTENDHKQELGGSSKSIVEKLRGTVSTWYVALRNIAIVGLLSALLYIGIRIVISSSAGDKAKYKQFFVDWVVALCLIFFMHYIMAFTMTMSETVTDVLAGNTTSQGRIQQVIVELTDKTGNNTFTETNGVAIKFKSNFTGLARIKADYDSISLKIGYTILYIALTVYTVYFAFVYLKRLLMLAFFTMIAPLVALTYPLDKIRDGKAQAFNYWFKEYMFYALLQPMHMLLYTVFVSSALSVAANNLLYAIVALAFIVPAEKIVKQMFGIKGNTESTLGGFAGGALASQAFNMLRKGPPQPKKGGGDGPKGEKGIRFNNPNKPNAMDTLAGSAAARQIGSQEQNAREETRRNNDDIERQQIEEQIADGQLTRDELTEEQRRILGMNQQVQDNANDNQENHDEEHPEMPENNQQQNQNLDGDNANENEQDDDPYAAARANANSRRGNLGTAINMRVQGAGGWSGIAKNAGKTGAKLAGRAAMMTTMGALGLGVGIVGGDMSDTLKGLGAGLTAGYATGGKLNSAVGNTITGNNAVGRFLDDAIRGTGPERQRSDYIRSYISNPENRNRLIEKNPHINKSELDSQLRQRAELSYDSGVTDAKKLDKAVKLKKKMDEQNPNGAGNAENRGINYDRTVATMRLAEKCSDSTFDDDDKIAKKQRRLAKELENSMRARVNGPIDASTARQMKAKANAEAAETMNNIDYLKNG